MKAQDSSDTSSLSVHSKIVWGIVLVIAMCYASLPYYSNHGLGTALVLGFIRYAAGWEGPQHILSDSMFAGLSQEIVDFIMMPTENSSRLIFPDDMHSVLEEFEFDRATGRGLRAARDIRAFEVVLVEDGILSGSPAAANFHESVYQQVIRLPDRARREVMKLRTPKRLAEPSSGPSSRPPTVQELVGSRLLLNGFSLAYYKRGAVALYPRAALVNHDCDPNLWLAAFEPTSRGEYPRIVFFATRDIKRGEQVGFNYRQDVNDFLSWPRSNRSQELHEKHDIAECSCDRCQRRNKWNKASGGADLEARLSELPQLAQASKLAPLDGRRGSLMALLHALRREGHMLLGEVKVLAELHIDHSEEATAHLKASRLLAAQTSLETAEALLRDAIETTKIAAGLPYFRVLSTQTGINLIERYQKLEAFKRELDAATAPSPGANVTVNAGES